MHILPILPYGSSLLSSSNIATDILGKGTPTLSLTSIFGKFVTAADPTSVCP